MGLNKLGERDDTLVHPLDNANSVGLNGERKKLPPREIPVDPRTLASVVPAQSAYMTDFAAIDAAIDAETAVLQAPVEANGNGVAKKAVGQIVLDEHDAFVASLNGRKGNMPSVRKIVQTSDSPDALVLRTKRLQTLRLEEGRTNGAAARRLRRAEGGLGRRLEGGEHAYVPASLTPDDLTVQYADWIKQATRDAKAQQRAEDKGWQDFAADIEKRVAADTKLDEQYDVQDALEAGDAKLRTERSLPKQEHLADYIVADRERRSSHQHGGKDVEEARVQRKQKHGGVRGVLAVEAFAGTKDPEANIDASITEALDRQEAEYLAAAKKLHGID